LDISESEDFKRIKAEHETLLAEAEKHRVERTELQELRAEIEKLKQSAVQKTQPEETIKRIMEEDHNQYVDPDKNWSEEYKAHRQRISNDSDYKVWYIKNQDRIYHDGIFDAGIDDENGVRLMEIEKKEAEEMNRFTNTLDKLLDKL
jgi:IS30 family transposase